jgi:hypothetical protein
MEIWDRMATAAQAIDRIIAATGEPAALVSYLARHLRDADTDLWPKGGKGGGRNSAHVGVRHVTNFLLAYLGADAYPLTHAPEVVTTFRSLKPLPGEWREQEPQAAVPQTLAPGFDMDAIHRLCESFLGGLPLQGSNFGLALESIITVAMDDQCRPKLRSSLQCITLAPRDKTAVIETREGNVYYAQPLPTDPGLPMEHAEVEPAARVQKSVKASVSYEFVEVLADLARDTQRVMSGSLLNESGPKTSTPPRATGAAKDLVNQPHANAGLAANNSSNGSEGRKQKQSFSPPGHGFPPRVAPTPSSRSEPTWPEWISPMPATG